MSIYHDEVEIEDFEYDKEEEIYYYPCPCGDQFQISKADLIAGEEEATCPSCSLIVKVIYDKEAFSSKQKEFVKDELVKAELVMLKEALDRLKKLKSSTRMAARGKGKPILSINTDKSDLAKGELPPVIQPPPDYPDLDLTRTRFEMTNELEYLVELKRGFVESMRNSVYYLQLDEEKKDIERYSDCYRETIKEKSVREIVDCDWSMFPAELAPSSERKKTALKTKSDKKEVIRAKRKKPRPIDDNDDDDGGNERNTEVKLEEQRSQQAQNNTDKEMKKIKEEEEEDEEEEENMEEYEEVDQEMDYGTDYLNNYFDNGEDLDDDDDNPDDGPVY